jgi:hypothetical protein
MGFQTYEQIENATKEEVLEFVKKGGHRKGKYATMATPRDRLNKQARDLLKRQLTSA